MRRWLRRLSLAALSLAALVLLAYAFLLPIIVRRQISSALAAAGVKAASFDLARTTLWQTELNEVSLGDVDPVRARRLTVDYSPQSLLRRHVKSVRIDGLALTVRRRGGRIEVGPLRDVITATTPSAGPADGDGAGAWPIESIRVTDGRIDIGEGEDTVTLPFEASLTQMTDDRLHVRAKSDDPGRAFALDGSWNPSRRGGSLELAAEGLSAAAVAAVVSTLVPGVQLAADGAASVTARATYSAVAGGTAEATLRTSNVRVSRTPGDANLEEVNAVLRAAAGIAPAASNAGGLVRDVVVTIEDAEFRSGRYDLAVTGLNGRLEIADPAAPDPAVPQRLRVWRVMVGETELADGAVEFALDGWRAVQVNQTAWRWLGGTVGSDDINVEAQTGRIRMAVAVDRVDLRQLLEFLAKDKATGDGEVSGRVNVAIDWPRIRLGEGELRAEPGGSLSVLDTTAIDHAVAQSGAIGGGGGGGEQVQRDVVEAITDFQYDVLRARLQRDPAGDGRMVARIKIAGRGRAGRRQPLELDLNVRGLEDLLNAYLGLQRRLPN